MFIKSEKVKVVSCSLRQKTQENGDISNYGILEIGDSVTGITEDIFFNNSSLDLLKGIKKDDLVTITLKNHNGRFNVYKLDIVK